MDAANSLPLAPGLHFYVFTEPGPLCPRGGYPDPAAMVDNLRLFGAAGLVVHGVGAAAPQLAWIERAAARFAAEGLPLDLSVSIGSRGPDRWLECMAQPVVQACAAGRAAMMDNEGASNHRRDAALRVAEYVQKNAPAWHRLVTHCHWWAPYFYVDRAGNHHATWADWPNEEFTRICGGAVFPQCYGAAQAKAGETPESVRGRSLHMLKWSRDPSQYPRVGTPASRVFPSFQAYARTVSDVAEAFVAEPTQVVWHYNQLDLAGAKGLRAGARVRADGFAAVAEWQRAHGLAADGAVGPLTLAAMGL
jgi:hypothetical protein